MTPQQIEQMRNQFDFDNYKICVDCANGKISADSLMDMLFNWFLSHIPEKDWPTEEHNTNEHTGYDLHAISKLRKRLHD